MERNLRPKVLEKSLSGSWRLPYSRGMDTETIKKHVKY
ncbi:MAG: hypothetical protein OFPII_08080 [Osedax symbiont Rs1]|nr:MAG: hypothetical protein OFPII_08080 [Osedax symbiont Rs1]